MDGTIKGFRARIVQGARCSNGGISEGAELVTVVATVRKVLGCPAVVEPVGEAARRIEPTEEAPPVAFVFRSGGSRALPVCAVPVDVADDGTITETRRDDSVGPMMGGSRVVAELGAEEAFAHAAGQDVLSVDLHDRFETTAQYATYD